MSLPVYLHSDMVGAPSLTPTNGSINALLNACLVNGFNVQSVVSATASGGVVTFNFASNPGFSALDTVTIAGATDTSINGQKRVQSAASNQVLVAVPGVPDGAVGGTITLKFSPLGWTRPYSGTNLGAYRQGGSATHKRFLRVYDGALTSAGGYEFQVRGYENMTAISTGTGAFPTTAQIAGNGISHFGPYDTTNESPNLQHRAWVIVGTPRFFALFMERDRIMSPTTSGHVRTPLSAFAHSTCYPIWFGELGNIMKPVDTFACICAGPAQFGSTTYVPRTVAGSGTSATVTYASGASSGGISAGLNYPSAADNGIHFTNSVYLYDAVAPYGFRGTIPGLLAPAEGPFSASANPVPVGTILQNINGVTGRVLLTAHSAQGYSDSGWLLDEDWGDL